MDEFKLLLARSMVHPLSPTDLDNRQRRAGAFPYFQTGCAALNELLQGGSYCGELTEFVGSSSTGKSQLCFAQALSVVLHEPSSVLYIDTTNSFSPARLSQIYHSVAGDASKEAFLRYFGQIRSHVCTDIFNLHAFLWELSNDLTAVAEGRKESFFLETLQCVIVDSLRFTPLTIVR